MSKVNIMYCPACNNQLKNTEYESQNVYICSQCGGMWFDKDTLYKIVDKAVYDNKIEYNAIKRALPTPFIHGEAVQAIRRCPRCGVDMRTFNFGYRSNIFLDICPSCEGIWADRDEMDQVIVYFKITRPVLNISAKILADAKLDHVTSVTESKELNEFSKELMEGGGWGLGWPVFPILLKDELPTEMLSKATIGIIIVNVIIFVLQLIFVHGDGKHYVDFVGVIPSMGFSFNRLYSFITSMFVHGEPAHILFNMFYLWIFGNNVEDRIGSLRFFIFYLLCGIAGSAVFCLAHPALTEPVIGASGAISGVLGAYLILFPTAKLKVFWLSSIRTVPAVFYLFIWIIFQLAYGAVALDDKEISTGYWAHIGGFIAGLLMIRFFKSSKEGKQ